MSVKKVRRAFEELKKFGQHKGKCTFFKECPECHKPIGVCMLHNKAMHKRLKNMEDAISELENKEKKNVSQWFF